MKIALGVAALALIVLFFVNLNEAADVRSLEARIDSLQVANAELRTVRIPRTDTVYSRDTLRKTVLRRTTDSILTTDTLWRVDTVRALLAGERAVCDQVIATCQVRVAQRDTALARADTISWAKDTVIAVLKRPCTYLGFVPCPEVAVFGGFATTGKPVAGIGIAIPLKRLAPRR